MFDAGAPDYFTYVIALSVEGAEVINAAVIKEFLDKYYQGLSAAVGRRKQLAPDYSKINAVVAPAKAGNGRPPQVSKARVAPSLPSGRLLKGPAPETSPGLPELIARRNGARHLVIRVPKFDIEGIDLMVPETILWNRATVLSWRDKPDLTWTERSPQRAAYDMQLPELRMRAEFIAHDDCVEQRFTATNLSRYSSWSRS